MFLMLPGISIFLPMAASTWSLLHSFGHPVFWIAIDPGNPDRMYASVVNYGGGGSSSQGGIWMTNDLENLASAQWVHLPAPPRTEGHPASIEVLNDGKMVCTFSGRINPSGSFTASSGVFIYDPGTNSWTDVSDPGMYYWTKDIIIDPNDANHKYLVCGRFQRMGRPAERSWRIVQNHKPRSHLDKSDGEPV